jgi:hypothetical protein
MERGEMERTIVGGCDKVEAEKRPRMNLYTVHLTIGLSYFYGWGRLRPDIWFLDTLTRYGNNLVY